MNQAAIDAVFRPKLNKQEVKADEITRNVRAIMSAEVTTRDSKTERLRALRLARDAQMPSAPAKKVRTVSRRVK
ncbi:hypothetical protein FY036_00335 [Mesorhizobium microcysteis]|uniref:Uncharacterized protein n=1 Tax=Neoaquamicrobium microcysteis TaxID=2682781 RepID=A0A5D4HAD2_9HYPH|nr:hypothetical protein [Mesorhizobium microcysteis]TYR37153.1 hypothetical protein FY036_00335 [Mesorhizobium microcysteis]